MITTPTDMKPKPRIGLALGGGGPWGGIYEIGALRALDEALEGLDFNSLDVYVGVNAGSFVAANLANQVTTAQLCRIFVRNEVDVHPFHPEVFYRPAFREMGKRLLTVPGLIVTAVNRYFSNPCDQSMLEALMVLTQAAPAGLFENESLHDYLKRAFARYGRTNDFRELSRSLYVVAADVESTETVRFGSPGFDHVPISKAIQASMATPGLYVPVSIDGRNYVDGTLKKGLHASVAFDEGADLVLAVNPQVPIDAGAAARAGSMRPGALMQSGMPGLLLQAFRTMVHSRMHHGVSQYAHDYPDKALVLFEPTGADVELFFASVFSGQSRRMICEYAYQVTRRDLLARADSLEPQLARYGIRLRRDYLEDEERTVSTTLYGNVLPLYIGKGQGKVKRSLLEAGLDSVTGFIHRAL